MKSSSTLNQLIDRMKAINNQKITKKNRPIKNFKSKNSYIDEWLMKFKSTHPDDIYLKSNTKNKLNLNELIESVELDEGKIKNLKIEEIKFLKEFKIPLIKELAIRSLEEEFNETVTETNFADFQADIPSDQMAGKLIKQFLLLKGLSKNAKILQNANKVLFSECELMLKEVAGDTARYNGTEYLLDGIERRENWDILCEAAEVIGANYSIHPEIKKQVLKHIDQIF